MIFRSGLILLFVSSLAFADSGADRIVVRDGRVLTETRMGKTWTQLSGQVEATTDLSVERLFAVITDWPSYPRLFPKVSKVEAFTEGGVSFLNQTMVVSVLGFSVTNRFTLRLAITGAAPGPVSMHWTQERTDGTIDGLEGGWDLEPTTENGRSGTLIRYRNVSSVPEGFFGQAGILGLFFPGEMKQTVASVLTEARQKKEKP